jgi:hypothetical protein
MEIYFEILEQELKNCQKHKEKYQLSSYNALNLDNCYNMFNDAILCAYQYIEKNHFKNKELLEFAKSYL